MRSSSRVPLLSGNEHSIRRLTQRNRWYSACHDAAGIIAETIPEWYRSRTFSGILGDIKALSSKKALSLISRKKGLGSQYAHLYLTQGIDGGRGYQACAAEALSMFAFDDITDAAKGRVLDVGCAVGVTAGVLGIDGVTGFDLFGDLIATAELIDSMTGAHNRYIISDMTKSWPFSDRSFDTIICGLVCHHLKEQSDICTFFSSAHRILAHNGRLIITLPSGSVADIPIFEKIIQALSVFGFETERSLTGMTVSTDSDRSLFWSFTIAARKTGSILSPIFIDPAFGFHLARTPVTRIEKGEKARETAESSRAVRHETFAFFPIDELSEISSSSVLVYDHVRQLAKI